MTDPEEKIRVFISYTHDDLCYVEQLVDYLEECGFQTLWDDKLKPGEGFTSQIQNLIVQSHVFIAFVTNHSNLRGWVQQEIGYALALNIPILPIAIGTDPVGIISGVEAVRLDRGSATQVGSSVQDHISQALSRDHLAKRLPSQTIHELVRTSANRDEATLCRFVWDNDARVRLLAEYAAMVRSRGYFGMVRQKTGLTSFCTMDVVQPQHLYWVLRYGGENHREARHLELIRRERNELYQHVQRRGCRLIIHAEQDYAKYGPASKLVRLAGLIDFLEHPPHSEVYAMLSPYPATGDSLTLVGDWFSATSVPIRLGTGHRQTVFSLHAPSARRLINSFDQEFIMLLEEQAIQESNSREYTIEKLRVVKQKEANRLGFYFPDHHLGREKILSTLKHFESQRREQE